MINILGEYQNGNYQVRLYADGTKIRTTEGDSFQAAFPESIDLKITNACDLGCLYCHEDSIPTGLHGDLNAPFLSTLRAGTELAIGGGNPLSHPDLVAFLINMQAQGVICNITVNQVHALNNLFMLETLLSEGLIHGLGISFTAYSDRLIQWAQLHPTVVFHVINGIISYDRLMHLGNQGLKVLILGYKRFRRGEEFYSNRVNVHQAELYANIHKIIKAFKIVSFDNLALEQLNARRMFTTSAWNSFYMGADGQHTMYVDLVKDEFATSSTTVSRYPLSLTIDSMFTQVLNYGGVSDGELVKAAVCD